MNRIQCLDSKVMEMLNKLMSLVLALLLFGCASVSSGHSFQFLMIDNKNVKLLDWKYSNQEAPSYYVKIAQSGGAGLSGARTIGLKDVGEFLYVKWQVPPDSKIYEKKVDLRLLLPWNMNGAEIRPSFGQDNELEIYLAVPDPSAPNVTRFRGSSYLKSSFQQIYPIVRKNLIN
ncbi:hypothetical protein [Hydrogenophaga sp. PAMC20947]|uniref:hypothetical protein n=1 Tax=Hydrogenophaga sp. PAMC20947 TaxID=2565558 RepID=UPI00109DD03F|nr:hypothetical protein [Hydrogenophaga sp. PAMC20947]QCB45136.1 hypothetical protein E5678_03275 [Hydrogenophaga sp. PAMC20947]